MSIDLRTCKAGDKLLSCHGVILTYVGYKQGAAYPHEVEYPDGGYGSRLDNGQVFGNNRLPTDEDIVEINPRTHFNQFGKPRRFGPED